MSGHGFTHRNDIPDITGMTPHQRWETNRIAADYSGYVRTDCANCGSVKCDCPPAAWLGDPARAHLAGTSPELPSFLSSEKTGPEPDASNVSGSGPIVGKP
jgi:hypothetical protein